MRYYYLHFIVPTSKLSDTLNDIEDRASGIYEIIDISHNLSKVDVSMIVVRFVLQEEEEPVFDEEEIKRKLGM